MSKPTVQLFVPPMVQIGVPFRVECEVSAVDAAKIEFIDVRILGTQGWAVGSGKSRVTERKRLPDQTTRVMGEGAFAAGESRRFAVELTIPPGAAPTHDTPPAYGYTAIHVHVSLPWRIDVRHSAFVPVRVPPPASLQRLPGTVAAGAGAGAPRIELALASVRLVAGEVLQGTVAVFHMDDREPRDVELALVPQFRLTNAWRERTRDGDGYRVAIRLPARSAGQAVAFAMAVPATAVPSFQALTQAVSWRLEARTGSFFGGKAATAIALEILDAAFAEVIAPPPPPPQIADDAILAQFRATTIKRPHASLSEDGLAIGAEVDGVHVSIAYEYRRTGDVYVATLGYPSLGLALTVTPSSAVRHLFITDLEVDVAGWDRAHYADARFGEQALPVMKAVIAEWPTWPKTPRDDRSGALVRWNDTELVYELPILRVDSLEIVAAFDRFERLARSLARARALITPPPGLVIDVGAWQELAAELDGTLSVGDLALTGTLGGLPVEVAWSRADDGADVFTAAVGGGDLVSPDVSAIEFDVAAPARFSTSPHVPDAVAAQLAHWPLDVQKLQVAGGVARARLVVRSDGGPASVEARRIRELLEGLRTVIATLTQSAGPYR